MKHRKIDWLPTMGRRKCRARQSIDNFRSLQTFLFPLILSLAPETVSIEFCFPFLNANSYLHAHDAPPIASALGASHSSAARAGAALLCTLHIVDGIDKLGKRGNALIETDA